MEELTREETERLYDLYLIYCEREGTHPSIKDFILWDEERRC